MAVIFRLAALRSSSLVFLSAPWKRTRKIIVKKRTKKKQLYAFIIRRLRGRPIILYIHTICTPCGINILNGNAEICAVINLSRTRQFHIIIYCTHAMYTIFIIINVYNIIYKYTRAPQYMYYNGIYYYYTYSGNHGGFRRYKSLDKKRLHVPNTHTAG